MPQQATAAIQKIISFELKTGFSCLTPDIPVDEHSSLLHDGLPERCPLELERWSGSQDRKGVLYGLTDHACYIIKF
ncbi:hypothetical protein QQF64_000997 [Cirrhinus molitorella]|uniref:Uncharacterized protein n=1 Tax=Cirrhinus molitorella TaxID=172907 RepID=A0ABR3NYT2_9TELE